MASGANERLVPMFNEPWCVECCDTHDPERRQAILERLDNPTPKEVYERLGELAQHLWPDCATGRRQLDRDIAALRKARNLPLRTAPPVNAAAIVRYWDRGLGPASIAFLLMESRDRVTHWLNAHGYGGRKVRSPGKFGQAGRATA